MTYVSKASTTAIGIIFPVLCIISLCIRGYGWKKYSREFSIDDIFLVFAAAGTIALGIAMATFAQLNIVGGHTFDPKEYTNIAKFEYGFFPLHTASICFIKLSLLFLFRRVFKGHANRTIFDFVNWTLIALTATWGVVYFIFQFAACGAHPDAEWISIVTLRTECVDTFALNCSSAVISFAMDLAILIEPLIMIRKLNMVRRKKYQASAVFLISGFAVMAGLLRLIPLIQVQTEGESGTTGTIVGTTLPRADHEGLISIVLFWAYIETGVGFQVACLPACAKQVDKLALSGLMHRVRSLTSLVSSQRSRASRDDDKTSDHGAEDRIQSQHPKPSSSVGHSEDDIEMQKFPSRRSEE